MEESCKVAELQSWGVVEEWWVWLVPLASCFHIGPDGVQVMDRKLRKLTMEFAV